MNKYNLISRGIAHFSISVGILCIRWSNDQIIRKVSALMRISDLFCMLILNCIKIEIEN